MTDLTPNDSLFGDSQLAKRLDAWLADLVTTFGQGRPGAEAEICAAALAHVGRAMAGMNLAPEDHQWALERVAAARDLLAAVVKQAEDERAAAAWLDGAD